MADRADGLLTPQERHALARKLFDLALQEQVRRLEEQAEDVKASGMTEITKLLALYERTLKPELPRALPPVNSLPHFDDPEHGAGQGDGAGYGNGISRADLEADF